MDRRKFYSAFFVSILILGMFIGMIGFSNDFVGKVAAPIITVNDDGGGADYSTIQDAINNATDGDTIYVWDGTYNEAVLVNKTVTIIGNGSATTTIQGTSSGDVVKVTSDWVNISGFEIINSGSGWGDSGVDISYVDNCWVYNNRITNNYFNVNLEWGNSNTIEHNYMKSSSFSHIYLYYSDSNTIYNNNCSTTTSYGIFLNWGSDGNTINNNDCNSTWSSGIYLAGSNGNTLENNTCCFIGWSGIYLYYSNGNTFNNNNCSDTDYGIYMDYCNNNVVRNTTVISIVGIDYYGIYLSRAWNNYFYDNTFISCGFGINSNTRRDWNTHTIDTSNKVNGYSVYYYKDLNDAIINPVDPGQIILGNCINITVKNFNLSDCSVGIIMGFSDDCVISNNNCSDSDVSGIYLQRSNNNIFDNNTCLNNYRYGIYIYYADSNIIENNTCLDCTNNYGIYVGSGSNYNNLKYNNCSNNPYGIYVTSATDNTLDNNTCNKNGNRGIHLTNSDNNIVINNYLYDNPSYGIFLDSSDWCLVENNTCFDGSHGIRLSYSYNNEIYNNTCYDGSSGIYFYNSDNNRLENNNCSNNNYGIYIYRYSSNNYISNNTCSDNNNYGIYIRRFSNDLRIENNTCISNNLYGIYLNWDSTTNLIKNNTCNDSNTGIYVYSGSHSNIVKDNTCNLNTFYGIHVESSNFNLVRENDCFKNKDYSIYLETTINSTVILNTIKSALGIGIDGGNNHTITNNNIEIVAAMVHGISFQMSVHNCTVAFNTIKMNQDKSMGIYLNTNQDITLSHNIIDTQAAWSYGIYIEKCLRITQSGNTINGYDINAAGLYVFNSQGINIYSEYVKSWAALNPGVTIINSVVNFYDSTILSVNNVSFNLSADAEVLAQNCVINSGNVIINDLTSNLTILNYLSILVTLTDLTPVPNMDVNVTNEGVEIYYTQGYGGTNPKTGPNGRVNNIITLSHKYIQSNIGTYYNTSILVKKSIQSNSWSSYRYNVDMSTSHTEHFISPVDIVKPKTPQFIAIESFPDGRALSLNWDFIPDATRYQLYVNGTGDPKGSFYVIRELVGNSSNSTDLLGLVDGIEYTFMVRARDTGGLWSDNSPQVVGIPIDTQPPAVPTGLNITEVTAKHVNLSWNQSTEHDLAGYRVYRIAGFQTTLLGTTTNTWFLDDTVKESKEYSYAISAYDEVPNHSPKTAAVGPVTIPILPPEIISRYPGASATGVPISVVIKVTFSKLMDPASVEKAFRIEPYVFGSFEWLNNTQTFEYTPESVLKYNTKYTITINTSAHDRIFNYNLSSPEIWSFTTELDMVPPTVKSYSPTGIKVQINSVIKIMFSEKMNKTSVEGAFGLTPSIIGIFSWLGNEIRYTPSSLLKYNQTYQVELKLTAADTAGNFILQSLKWNFTTLAEEVSPPLVIDHGPTGSDVPVDTEIYIEFNKPMNQTLTQSALKITPWIKGDGFEWEDNKMIFTHSTNFETNSTYKVTLSTITSDSWGNRLAKDFSWEFSTSLEDIIPPPKIISLVPTPESEVEINTKLEIRFSSSISYPGTNLVLKNKDGDEVNGTVKYNDDSKSLSLNLGPGKHLDYGTSYSLILSGVEVDTGKYDLKAGNNTYSWNFNTKTKSNADSDSDGMDDQWEDINKLDPFESADADTDSDEDGLTNFEEYKNTTDPNNNDSDGDELTDGDEVNKYATDPNKKDSDNDGFDDNIEISEETDPNDETSHPPEKKEKKEEEAPNYMLIAAIIIIIIIVLLILFFMLRRKKHEAEEGEEKPGKEKGRKKKEDMDEFELLEEEDEEIEEEVEDEDESEEEKDTESEEEAEEDDDEWKFAEDEEEEEKK